MNKDCTLKQKLVHYGTNWVLDLVGVFESLVGVFTLGIVTPGWRLDVAMWKLRTIHSFDEQSKQS